MSSDDGDNKQINNLEAQCIALRHSNFKVIGLRGSTDFSDRKILGVVKGPDPC